MDRTIKRLALGAAVLFFLLMLALPASADQVLVIVAATGQGVDHPEVESLVAALKKQRIELGLDPEEYPLIRLSSVTKKHRSVRERLGLGSLDEAQLLLCRRDSSGWPTEVLKKMSDDQSVRDFLITIGRTSSTQPESPSESEPTNVVKGSEGAEVGLLLAYEKSEDPDALKEFLTELGRYWMERYGRTSPQPYPLASYDTSDVAIRASLESAVPSLVEKPGAVVALASFVDRRPVEILEIHRELDLPASLVRRLSASRRRHLTEMLITSPLPGSALPSGYDDDPGADSQVSVSIARIHELATQLWGASSRDSKESDRLALKALIAVMESSKDGHLNDALLEAMADFVTEPLDLAPDSELRSSQRQLLQLMKTLID